MTLATPRDAQRLEALEDTLLRLREAAAGNAALVEGQRDAIALESLGVGGTHILVHRGLPIEAVIDDVASRFNSQGWHQVILLVDWDRTGGRLFRRLRDGLAPRVRLNIDLRRRLARASHSKAVEDLPAEIASLRDRVGGRP